MTSRRKYTFTLSPSVVEDAKKITDNLSETVDNLLRDLITRRDREKFLASLKKYEESSKERRESHGIFSDSTRKFL